MKVEVLKTQPSTARIVVADDHDLVRDGYQRMIEREPDLEVVGEAANGREVLEYCRRLQPDLVLMDVRMPVMDGLEATRAIKQEIPTTSVLAVTTYEDPDYLLEALKAGAAGYVLKDTPKDQLVSAVRKVLSGDFPLNQKLAAQLIRQLGAEIERHVEESSPEPEMGHAPTLEPLTPREQEVLKLLGRGQTNQEIAQNLVVSRGTVKTHVQNIIRKLGVSDRTQAVIRGIELGLIDPGKKSAQ